MSDEIINKVASSSLVTIDLEEYCPKEEIVLLDIKPYLFMELILKEKEFRDALNKTDWVEYKGKIVAVICSVDAIIPAWAYMLIATYLKPNAVDVILGDQKQVLSQLAIRKIELIDTSAYIEKRIIIKGCGKFDIDAGVYLEITKKLLPVAKSIFYGEACSNVPVYKKK
jgi:Protein of unknown function (DUF2480)